jgi:beta-phosphoglucomutase-like phosphatase (HAD superfamily)
MSMFRSWWNKLNEAGILVPKWMIHRRVGMSGKSFVTELLREFAPQRKINISQLDEEYDARIRKAVSEIAPLRGADDLLAHLRRSKVRFAIAITGNREQTSLLLKKAQDTCRNAGSDWR